MNDLYLRKMRGKRLLSAAAAFLFVCLLAACGRNAEETYPTLPHIEPELSVAEENTEASASESTGASAPESTAASSSETMPSEIPSSETDPQMTSSEKETEPTLTTSAAAASSPESKETKPETKPEDTLPVETTEADPAPGTKSGLWSTVPTEKADWATRADSEIVYYHEDFGFTRLRSAYDRDGDGTDDLADMLQGAKDYVATRPVYDTGYFAGGWPPAGRGVCTDVVAYALKAAGYDLQAMVDADVKKRPDAYPAGAGDKNIDYRRTRNLYPFFEQYFEKLTLDPYDYEAWQPGDIVLFAHPEHWLSPGHVAIVSDRRAADGLPYLIHHTDNDRYSYEQDYLTTPKRIILGHYRPKGEASIP